MRGASEDIVPQGAVLSRSDPSANTGPMDRDPGS